MCLNLATHTKVCSPTCVLKWWYWLLIGWGQYSSLHRGSMWLRKWKLSIVLVTLSQSWSSGGGKGSGERATRSLHRLHILSYANIASGGCPFSFASESNHPNRMKNTCEGDSDLHRAKKIAQCSSKAFLQKGLKYVLNLGSISKPNTYL